MNQKGMPSGHRHPKWEDDVGYRAIHNWVRSWKTKYEGGTPIKCENCGETKEVEIACLIEEASPDNPELYTRKVKDYAWLCRKCHKKMDEGNEDIRQRMISLNSKKYTGDEWAGK